LSEVIRNFLPPPLLVVVQILSVDVKVAKIVMPENTKRERAKIGVVIGLVLIGGLVAANILLLWP